MVKLKCEICGEELHDLKEVKNHMKEKHGKETTTKESFRVRT